MMLMLGCRGLPSIVASVLLFAAPVSVLAQASAGVQINAEDSVPVRGDFQLGPTRFHLTLAPGEEQTVTLQILSRMGAPATYRLTSEDFGPGEDPLDPTHLYGTDDGPFAARTWLTPGAPSVLLQHGERAFVTIRVRVPRDAEPGDHYAALLVEREPEGDAGFNVVSRVGTLFLLTVKGSVVRQGAVTDLLSRHSLYWASPIVLRLTAQNEGTVHMIPDGSVIIHNMFGLPVAELPVERWIVLRDSTRAVDLPWEPAFALGRYTASTHLRLFGQESAMLETSFWVIPVLPLLFVALIVFVVSFLVQYFFARFEVRRRK